MGKITKPYQKIVIVACSIVTVYLLLIAAYSLKQGYSWEEMDWDEDGSTSIGEFFAASDIGVREVEQNGKKCTEYFAYKDGLAIKIICHRN